MKAANDASNRSSETEIEIEIRTGYTEKKTICHVGTYLLNFIYYSMASVGEKLTTLKTQRWPQYSIDTYIILYTYLATYGIF